MKILIIWWLIGLFLPVYANAKPRFVIDQRYCYADIADIPRGKGGKIKRSAQVLRDFQKIHPCPVTSKTIGSCPRWAINHVIPLSVGGCDSVFNLQWLPDILKTCPGTICIDRFERRIYNRNFGK